MPTPAAATFRSTDFSERLTSPASPNEVWLLDQGRATRTILTPWTTRRQAVLDFVGYPEILTDGTTRFLSRVVPANYPGESYIWCVGAPKIEGVGPIGFDGVDESHIASYQYADVTLQYGSLPYTIYGDDAMRLLDFTNPEGVISEGIALKVGAPRYVSIAAKPGMRTLVFNRALIKRSDTNSPLLEGFPLQQPYTDLEFTWHDIPAAALNWDAWAACQGHVNDVAFYGFPAETLLMEAPQPNRITGPFGDIRYNVIFRMRYLPNVDSGGTARGWNYVLVPTGTGAATTLTMVKLTANGLPTGTTPYQPADFTRCFEPPTP